MTDRELLELAAKAAGIAGFWVDDGLNTGSNATPTVWNPITDDGDALRLAVKLNINIGFGIFATQINCEIYDWAEDEVLIDWKEDGRKDPYTATRRAIVRAAAEIGRNMK
jgi:hypothetical protein